MTNDFDYRLPGALIAQHPVPRGRERLLVLGAEGHPSHRRFDELPSLLFPGDLLVVNDSEVIPARLFGRRRPGGGRIEMLLAEKTGERDWTTLLKPGRRAAPGTWIDLSERLRAEVVGKGPDGRFHLRFSEPVEGHLAALGHIPLPPYIRRPDEPRDRRDYQTVFARHPGSVAAPTAGLHFDGTILERLETRGVERVAVTLHVGLGTFKPVTSTLVHEHTMDREAFTISPEAAERIGAARREGRRVVAVGTTVVRALEAAATDGEVQAGGASTELFILPGFRFRAVDLLLTNFHLPRSTLLMLVCALGGRDRVLSAYDEAIARGYRFYSYGDAMLVAKQGEAVGGR